MQPFNQSQVDRRRRWRREREHNAATSERPKVAASTEELVAVVVGEPGINIHASSEWDIESPAQNETSGEEKSDEGKTAVETDDLHEEVQEGIESSDDIDKDNDGLSATASSHDDPNATAVPEPADRVTLTPIQEEAPSRKSIDNRGKQAMVEDEAESEVNSMIAEDGHQLNHGFLYGEPPLERSVAFTNSYTDDLYDVDKSDSLENQSFSGSDTSSYPYTGAKPAPEPPYRQRRRSPSSSWDRIDYADHDINDRESRRPYVEGVKINNRTSRSTDSESQGSYVKGVKIHQHRSRSISSDFTDDTDREATDRESQSSYVKKLEKEVSRLRTERSRRPALYHQNPFAPSVQIPHANRNEQVPRINPNDPDNDWARTRSAPYPHPYIPPSYGPRYDSPPPPPHHSAQWPHIPPPPTPPRPYPPTSPSSDDQSRSPLGSVQHASDSDELHLPYSKSRKRKSNSRKLRSRNHSSRLANAPGYLNAKSFLNTKKGLKCHPYNIPVGANGEILSIDVRIIRSDRNQILENGFAGLWRWSDAESTGRHAISKNAKLLKISGANRWFDDSKNHHMLDLTCMSGPSNAQAMEKTSMRWLHVERQKLDFDEFKAIVLSAPNLSRDWNLVLLSLLKQIQRLHHYHSTDRFYPWTLRADSSNLGLSSTKDTALSALSTSLPYFVLSPISGQGTHPIMTLFEWDDRFESTKEWDSEQTFRVMDRTEDKDSIIHIPHVWTMAFNDTIVTYGQIAFDDLVDGESIKLIELNQTVPSLPNSVEVTDVRGCQFVFSLDQCRTFFALKQSIKVHCFVNMQSEFDTVDIFASSNRVVNGEKWISLLQEQDSSIIKLQLRHKSSTPTTAAITPKMPVKPSEGVRTAELEARTHLSDTSNTVLGSKTTDAELTESNLSESSSASDSDSDSAQSNLAVIRHDNSFAMRHTQQSSRVQPKAALPDKGAMVPYNYIFPDSKTPSVPPKKLYPSPPSKEVANARREEALEERGVILFDKNTLQSSPEIYAPPSNAVVRFRLPLEVENKVPEQAADHYNQHAQINQQVNVYDFEETGSFDLSRGNNSKEPLEINIPHFLSWATSQESIIDDTSNETSIDTIVKVLGTVHQGLLQNARLPGHKRAYRKSKKLVQVELEALFPPLKVFTRDQTFPKAPHTIENDQLDTRQALLESTTLQSDIVHTSLLQACDRRLKRLYTVLNSFLSLYLPLASPSTSDHPLVHKCWGAFGMILNDITLGTKHAIQIPQHESESWIVRDPSFLHLLSNRRKPAISWKECGACRNLVSYKSLREAIQHIHRCHYDSSWDDDTDLDHEMLTIWLRNTKQYCTDHRLEMYAHYLDLVLEPLQEIYSKGKGIWDGVASGQSSMPSQVMLPKSLVEAFENVVLLLVSAVKPFPIVGRYSSLMTQKSKESEHKVQRDRELLDAAGREVSFLADLAKECMQKAEQDIMIMAYTEKGTTETVSYDKVGPEYLLATVMANLFNRPLYKEEQIDMVYAGFYRRLQLDAMKHPRTRVLDRIWRMREELEVILDVNMQQQELLRNYLRILEPCTFRATTFIRAARFRVEAPYLSAQLQRAHAARLRISDLDSRLEDVSTHVSRMLEVQQENNGNAIIVFTIVTIIFLPLSWVTSYLGMNTSDVRDLAQGQWLYWTISLPVTMLVIGIAVLVVLKGESVREFFIRRQMVGDRRGVTAGSMSAKTGFSTRMTDASLARKQSTMRPNNLLGRSGLWRRSTRAGRAGEV